tara:strand:+ start:471 stop:728 length:258 start_codon:yes stop_codon:yes gene_type:complete
MNSDPRITNQKEYLKGVILIKKKYSQPNENWDHDHCEFCWDKFAEENLIPTALHEGYVSQDGKNWICENCFQDFKESFSWKLTKS